MNDAIPIHSCPLCWQVPHATSYGLRCLTDTCAMTDVAVLPIRAWNALALSIVAGRQPPPPAAQGMDNLEMLVRAVRVLGRQMYENSSTNPGRSFDESLDKELLRRAQVRGEV